MKKLVQSEVDEVLGGYDYIEDTVQDDGDKVDQTSLVPCLFSFCIGCVVITAFSAAFVVGAVLKDSNKL